MPDMDGLDLCRMLRTQYAALPVLMLTARDGLGDKLDGFEAGADDYLPKPFDLKIFLARLAGLIRRSEWSRRNTVADVV